MKAKLTKPMILKKGKQVFGSTELFNLWLNRDHVLLECKPITLWETKKGLQMIYGELVHIEYGECC
jgi:uncharacterized protein (DUF2384 family)